MGTLAVELPSGIVTFVFTDIEGSTRLFHRLGDRYVSALDRHRQILRSCWEAHRGHEVSVEGDSFLVAFADAEDAVRACREAQRRLAAESWPEEAPLRVRMGLHTGLASPRDGAYVSLTVHQAARVVAAGHGGQILLSQETAAALDPHQDVDVVPLGRFRLRGFDAPVRLYQVTREDPETRFPAVRAVPADGHNIVEPPTPILGRDELITSVAETTGPGRLLTLIGPGGVGKSRLATEVGIRVTSAWEDGVWRADLSALADAELLAGAVAEAVGAPTLPEGDRLDDVLHHLETRNALVVLDGCEHLLTACREISEAVLTACREVGVLATSREPLRTPGERLWPVDPLPTPSQSESNPAGVLATPAGRLFAQRGAAVRPDFQVNSENAAAVARICRHLDGLPLLLELAAAHLSARSTTEILAGLDDRFRLLRSPDPLISDRHRTVEGLLDWSHRLLEESEQVAFRRLAVFGGSFSLETAAAAVSDDDLTVDEVPVLVWSLVDRSLVVADLASNDTRYRLLETVRAFGRRILTERGETGAVASRLATFLLERLGPWLPADRHWVGEVGVELSNLRSLVPLLPEDRQELAQQVACSIGRYHDAVQTFRAGITELRRYVAALERPTPTRVSLLTLLADLHLRTGEVSAAEELVAEAERLRDRHGVPEWDDVGIERTRGEIARRSGDLERAVQLAREALSRPLSDRGRSRMYNLLGTTLAALGDLDGAYRACTQELELNRLVGYEGYVASAHGNLAEVALRLGDLAGAARHQRACLELATAQGSRAMVAFSLIVAARVAGARRSWETAVRLHARAEDLLAEIGLVLYEDDQRRSEDLLEAALNQLGREGFQQLAAEGREMSLPDAVDLADEVLADAGRGD